MGGFPPAVDTVESETADEGGQLDPHSQPACCLQGKGPASAVCGPAERAVTVPNTSALCNFRTTSRGEASVADPTPASRSRELEGAPAHPNPRQTPCSVHRLMTIR